MNSSIRPQVKRQKLLREIFSHKINNILVLLDMVFASSSFFSVSLFFCFRIVDGLVWRVRSPFSQFLTYAYIYIRHHPPTPTPTQFVYHSSRYKLPSAMEMHAHMVTLAGCITYFNLAWQFIFHFSVHFKEYETNSKQIGQTDSKYQGFYRKAQYQWLAVKQHTKCSFIRITVSRDGKCIETVCRDSK